PPHSAQEAAGPRKVPVPRSAPAPRRPRHGKIAQRIVPYELRPLALRDELVELGDLFRAYQQRTEPDLAYLADLHTRKARAFATWAEITGDGCLRRDARRAEQAADAARLQHQQRTGQTPDGGRAAVARLLTGHVLWEHARTVLAHVADHAPLPGPQARLLTLVLTLRTAHTGSGNLVGQDVTALGLSEPEALVEQLTGCGWLVLPGTVGELLASRPENATPVTVPCLTPRQDAAGPFTFGRKTRPKLSGWAQKVISDKKLRKAKATAGARLLALTLATQCGSDGRIGPHGQGAGAGFAASRSAVAPGELQPLVDQLVAADWLAEAALDDTHLTGRLSERVLPLSCPLA
ncbi:hypothetical protein, partial [Streptomyces apricus]